MVWMKKNLQGTSCVGLVLALCGVAGAQMQAGQGAAPPKADPVALPGDTPLPPVDVQLHVPVGITATTQPQAQKPATMGVTLALAMEAAEAALKTCAADGYAVGVAVTDEKGQLIVGLSADGAAPRGVYTAVRKDTAAATFKVPTSALRSRAADPGFLAQIKPNMALFPGAVPLMVGDRAVGAIGTSGAYGTEEEKCSGVGAEKIRARIK